MLLLGFFKGSRRGLRIEGMLTPGSSSGFFFQGREQEDPYNYNNNNKYNNNNNNYYYYCYYYCYYNCPSPMTGLVRQRSTLSSTFAGQVMVSVAYASTVKD